MRIFHRIFNGFGDGLFNGGISLGENRGKLTVALGVDYPREMEKSFYKDTPDHRILAIALDKKRKGETYETNRRSPRTAPNQSIAD